MSARLLHVQNPLAPDLGAQCFACEPGISVAEAIAASRWRVPPSTVLLRKQADLLAVEWNSAAIAEMLIPRREWDTTIVNDNEEAVLVTLPLGGGQGSSPIRIIAEIVIIIIATYLAGPAGGGTAVGGFLGIGASAGAALVQAAVVVAGNLLLSAILPVTNPNTAGSPSYELGVPSNQARLGQAIPEHFGLFNMVPDFAAAPYFVYVDNQQELYSTLILGRGEYAVHQLRINENVFADDSGGTLVSTATYPEIEWEIVPPGGTATLFTDNNVATSQEVAAIRLFGPQSPSWAWTAWFAANPPHTQTNHIAIDITCPAGINNGSGGAFVEATWDAMPIDDDGNQIADTFRLTQISLAMKTHDPQRMSLDCIVPAGRYLVRGQRTSNETTGGGDTLVWAALRAYLAPVTDADFGDVTRLLLHATATQNLNNSSSDQVNVVQTRKLPIYDPIAKTWSAPTATRSIAWAAAYVAKQKYSDAQVDLDWLADYESTVWSVRGDTFDGVFDGNAGGNTWFAALQTILGVGRSQAIVANGMLAFSRDEPKSAYRCAFSPRNMIADTFTTHYQMATATDVDALAVSYVDSRDWKTHQVLCALAGSTQTLETATPYTAFGINNYAQAWREGMFRVATNRYRRIFPSFDTELDGRVCFRGDAVQLAHWSARWGASADALDLVQDGAGDIVTLSEPWSLSLDPTGGKIVLISTPDGQTCGPIPVTVLDDGSDTKRAVIRLNNPLATPHAGKNSGKQPRDWICGLDGTQSIWSGEGLQLERPRVQMGQGIEKGQEALIVSMKPGVGKTSVSCVIENPAVHLVDIGSPPAEPDPPPLGATDDLTITSVTISEAPASHSQFAETFTVHGATAATAYDWRIWSDADPDDPPGWTPSQIGVANGFVIRFKPGPAKMQVRATKGTEIGSFFERDFDAGSGGDAPGLDFSQPVKSGAVAAIVAMGIKNG